ncbi:hypothetical protein OIU19_02560 [Pseudomonas sp. BT-42-2]|uniref:hypothetical protein n=1 Tax=Pseudomonas sp. BT-42-2 TaxID=2986927 RepID=UPI0021F6F577|nr:hypothetical protein [Pseudomonas sp. BT-42-2]MCV9917662.1 hypothetical protein [Pseudomonas sp. BT-42-2]
MSEEKNKSRIAREILEHLHASTYLPDQMALFVYLLWLDDKIYLYDDEKFCEIIRDLRSMDAGDEFTYTKEEIIEMLTPYVIPIT